MKKHLIFLFSISIIVFAGDNPRSIKAVKTQESPVIDGYVDDAVWTQAQAGADFIQRDPIEGVPATEKTIFKILYDDDNLYVSAMMYDANSDSIVARLARRDDLAESDFFAIGLDSYNDKQTAFVFLVLASGTKVDYLAYSDGKYEDYSWDPVWEVQTRILPDGWSAEMKIPLSQIRFTQGNDLWGVNAARKISRKQEEMHWSLMSKSQDGFASQFGTLSGMADVKLPALFEVLPYAVGSSEHYPQKTDRVETEKIRPNAGVDIKYGISSNFTLDATINPDFAQVEADPAVLNLTTFETFYPEKRPFFIEGTQIIRFVTFGGEFGPGLFYSRRIGKPISVRLPEDGEIITDEPRSATILGAVKFSGKTESGTSIGVLSAMTQEEEFSYRDTLGIDRTRPAEPAASFNLLRVKQDFWNNSTVGGILTATARDGRNPAYTAGSDWDIKFGNNNYRATGFYAYSRIVDPSEAEREGSAGKMNFSKVSGEWIWSTNADFTSRRYFINDIGFFNSPNDYGASGNVGYRNFTPGTYFRSYRFSLSPHLRWNYDGLTLFREIRFDAIGQLLNYWWIEGSVQYTNGEKDPYEPRGYGVYNFPSSVFVRAEIETDNRAPIVINLEENFRRNTQGATIQNTGLSIALRPTSAMEYRITLAYATDRGLHSFAAATTDSLLAFSPASPVAVFGRRDVDRTDLTLRSSILFTNNLSLQIYNQFFWAKGRYNEFSVLQPDGNLASYAYSGNVDFNRTSFNSNVVLRWEYREGSTFYVVWSHGRMFRQQGGYATDLGTNIDNTFGAAPDNTYVVKVSYWLGL
ncbi:MAG: DUF5916 domain-containing protein [Bacteroidota bacterium]